MMKRFEKYGDVIIKTITSPLRALIGLGICIKKNMPDKVEFPFTIKRKEENDRNTNTKEKASG
jgi:hypothetical protein